MVKKVITMPTASNPFLSPAIRAGDYIFTSGQVVAQDDQGNPVNGIEAQTSLVLEKLKGILEVEEASLDDVVKTTVFLVNVDDFSKMNEVYGSYFKQDRPARSTIVVAALAKPEYVVEIECVAYKP